MKNWKKLMAGFCVAAMVSSMVVPVWATDDAAAEEDADGDEADYNQTYQDMGDILTECYSGETEAGETFIYAANDDGTFCSVLVIDQDDNYVSFVGEGTFDEENGTVTITDEVSEMALTFGVVVNDDDTLTLDMGDLGSATVEEATLAVAVQGLKYAVENGTEMN